MREPMAGRADGGEQLTQALGALRYQVLEVLRARFGARSVEVSFDPSTLSVAAAAVCRIRGSAAIDGTYWAVHIEAGEIHTPGRVELEVVTRPLPAGGRTLLDAA